jgi:hypothetical protein
MESDETKRCQNMKSSQRACLGSMEKKCDMAWRCGDVDRRRDGLGREKGGDDISWVDVNLTVPKNKENTCG